MVVTGRRCQRRFRKRMWTFLCRDGLGDTQVEREEGSQCLGAAAQRAEIGPGMLPRKSVKGEKMVTPSPETFLTLAKGPSKHPSPRGYPSLE